MIRHCWTVVCSRSSMDSESHNVSMFEVLEQLTVQGPLPEGRGQVVMPHEVVSLWTREDLEKGGSAEARHGVIAPSGWSSQGKSLQIDLTRYNRLRSRARQGSFPLEGPGLYWITTEFRKATDEEWQEVSRVPLEVRVQIAQEE
jgi:hypothetical protein